MFELPVPAWNVPVFDARTNLSFNCVEQRISAGTMMDLP